MFKTDLTSIVKSINKELSVATDITLNINMGHMYDRAVERDLMLGQIKKCLMVLRDEYLMQFVYYSLLADDIKPFTMYVKYGGVIQLSRVDSNWRVTTVLDAALHNKNENGKGFKVYIDMDR